MCPCRHSHVLIFLTNKKIKKIRVAHFLFSLLFAHAMHLSTQPLTHAHPIERFIPHRLHASFFLPLHPIPKLQELHNNLCFQRTNTCDRYNGIMVKREVITASVQHIPASHEKIAVLFEKPGSEHIWWEAHIKDILCFKFSCDPSLWKEMKNL